MSQMQMEVTRERQRNKRTMNIAATNLSQTDPSTAPAEQDPSAIETKDLCSWYGNFQALHDFAPFSCRLLEPFFEETRADYENQAPGTRDDDSKNEGQRPIRS